MTTICPITSGPGGNGTRANPTKYRTHLIGARERMPRSAGASLPSRWCRVDWMENTVWASPGIFDFSQSYCVMNGAPHDGLASRRHAERPLRRRPLPRDRAQQRYCLTPMAVWGSRIQLPSGMNPRWSHSQQSLFHLASFDALSNIAYGHQELLGWVFSRS